MNDPIYYVTKLFTFQSNEKCLFSKISTTSIKIIIHINIIMNNIVLIL